MRRCQTRSLSYLPWRATSKTIVRAQWDRFRGDRLYNANKKQLSFYMCWGVSNCSQARVQCEAELPFLRRHCQQIDSHLYSRACPEPGEPTGWTRYQATQWKPARSPCSDAHGIKHGWSAWSHRKKRTTRGLESAPALHRSVVFFDPGRRILV